MSTKRFNNSRSGCGSLAHRKHLFNVSYKAQNSTQDDTANQFNDAGEVLDNPFIVEDNKGTKSKEYNIKMVQIITKILPKTV